MSSQLTEKNYVPTSEAVSTATANKVVKRDANADVIVPTTPTAAGGATSKTYVDTLTSMGAGGLTTRTQSSESATNFDETITLGFRPRFIQINYYLKGTSGYVNGTSEKGIAYYNGATYLYKFVLGVNSSVTTDTVIQGNYVGTYMPTSCYEAAVPSQGSSGGKGVTLSVLSVSDTGFVVRVAFTNWTTDNAVFKGSYVAFA